MVLGKHKKHLQNSTITLPIRDAWNSPPPTSARNMPRRKTGNNTTRAAEGNDEFLACNRAGAHDKKIKKPPESYVRDVPVLSQIMGVVRMRDRTLERSGHDVCARLEDAMTGKLSGKIKRVRRARRYTTNRPRLLGWSYQTLRVFGNNMRGITAYSKYDAKAISKSYV